MREAERWMRDAIELHSENYLIYYYHAMLSSEASLTQELNTHVEEDLRRSIALNPDFAPAHSVLGLTLIRRHDDWPEALALGQKAVQEEPGNFSVRINFGRMLMEMNRTADALKLAQATQLMAGTPEEHSEADSFLSAVQAYTANLAAVAAARSQAAQDAAVAREAETPNARQATGSSRNG